MSIDTKSLKPGDRVGVVYDRSTRYVGTISRVTPSGQVVLVDGDRFTADGYRIGDGGRRWGMAYLTPAGDVERWNAEQEAARTLRECFGELASAAGKAFARRSMSSGPQPLSAEERAELLALIDRCSAPVEASK